MTDFPPIHLGKYRALWLYVKFSLISICMCHYKTIKLELPLFFGNKSIFAIQIQYYKEGEPQTYYTEH